MTDSRARSRADRWMPPQRTMDRRQFLPLVGIGLVLVVVAVMVRSPWLVGASVVLLGVVCGLRALAGRREIEGLLTGALFALAAVTLLLHWTARLDGFGLLGAILAYLGIGRLLGVARRRAALRHLGAPWLAACAIGLGVALAAIHPGLPRWALLVAAASVLLAPVGMSLLSADVISRLDSAGPRVGAGVAAAGAALAGTAVVTFAAVADNVPPQLTAAAVVVAAVVVWAIVVDNEADVRLVAVVLALLLSTTPRDAEVTQPFSPGPGDTALVALGDSYMSGEGASVYFSGTDDAGGNECRRSPTAYTALSVHPDAVWPRLAFLACSGARTHHIHLRGQYGDAAQLTQLDRIRGGGAEVALVVVSIGGNDASFAEIGATCLAPGSCDEIAQKWTGPLTSSVREKVAAAYDAVRRRLTGPDGRLGTPIAVVPYPIPLSRTACGDTWLTPAEHAFLVDLTIDLNSMLRREADRAGLWYVAPMERALQDRGLQLCGSAENGAGVHFIGLRSVKSLVIEQRLNPAKWLHNSLHPNERGHAAMRDTLIDWVRDQRQLGVIPATGRPLPDQTAIARGHNSTARPLCSVADVDGSDCLPDARTWALGQAMGLLWPGSLIPVTGFTGMWLFWLGVTALWRGRQLNLNRTRPLGEP